MAEREKIKTKKKNKKPLPAVALRFVMNGPPASGADTVPSSASSSSPLVRFRWPQTNLMKAATISGPPVSDADRMIATNWAPSWHARPPDGSAVATSESARNGSPSFGDSFLFHLEKTSNSVDFFYIFFR